MTVSQVARFVHTPKRSHELTLICIDRYLKGTVNRGLMIRQMMLSYSKRMSLSMQRLLVAGELIITQIQIVLNLAQDISLKSLIVLSYEYHQYK